MPDHDGGASMLSRDAATKAVRAAKAELGVTWSQLAEAVGRPPAWTTAALLGQHPMTREQAQAAVSLLDLRTEVADAHPDPAGDRVVVTLNGKFLPYQWD
jgi:cyanate lyase